MQQITVFIDLQDQLNMFRTKLCPSSGIFLHTKHIGPRCRPPDRQPTTTTGHNTTCCNLQSYAPDDGHSFVRNMLSWSWRSINTVICCICYFVIVTSDVSCASEEVKRLRGTFGNYLMRVLPYGNCLYEAVRKKWTILYLHMPLSSRVIG
jgi:hypothetical protein